MSTEAQKPKWVNPVIIIGGVSASIFSIIFGAAHLKNQDSSHFRANSVMQCAAGGQVAVMGLAISEAKTYGDRVAICIDKADVIYPDPIRDKSLKAATDFTLDAGEPTVSDPVAAGKPDTVLGKREPLKID